MGCLKNPEIVSRQARPGLPPWMARYVSNWFGDRFAQRTTTRRRNNGRPLAANPNDHQRDGQADN
jgi:hypothetical protein